MNEHLWVIRTLAFAIHRRGSPGVDLSNLAWIIARIGDAALALGPELETFEVNPLLARGTHIETLDALAVRGMAS